MNDLAERAIMATDVSADFAAAYSWVYAGMMAEGISRTLARPRTAEIDASAGGLSLLRDRARVHAELGDFQTVVDACSRVIQWQPTADDYHFRGHARAALGDLDGALRDLDEAIARQPGQAPFHFTRGIVLQLNKQPGSASEEYTTVLRLDPGFTLAYFYRGLALQEVGARFLASTDLAEAVRRNPRLADASWADSPLPCLLEVDWRASGSGAWVAADPSVMFSCYLRAMAFVATGQQRNDAPTTPSSSKGGQAARHADPRFDAVAPIVHLLRAHAYHGLSYMHREFLPHLAEITRSLPDAEAAVHLRTAVVLSLSCLDARGAIEFASRLLTWAETAPTYCYRGLAQGMLGGHDLAVRDLTEALRLQPDEAAFFHARGLAYYLQGNLPAAVADYCEAIQRNPNLLLVFYHRSMAYRRLGSWQQARDDLTEAVQLNSGLPGLWHARSRYYWLWEQIQRVVVSVPNVADKVHILWQPALSLAMPNVNEVIARVPTFAMAYVDRAIIRYLDDDYTGALTDCDTALAIQVDNPYAYWQRGRIRAKLQDYFGAARDLQQAADLFGARGNRESQRLALAALAELPPVAPPTNSPPGLGQQLFVFIDTSSLMNPQAAAFLERWILPLAVQPQVRILLATAVEAELQKHLNSAALDKRTKAEAASGLVKTYKQLGILHPVGEADDDTFADSQFLTQFNKFRQRGHLCMVTNDRGLATDVLMINQQISVQSPFTVSAFRIAPSAAAQVWVLGKDNKAHSLS